MREEGRPRYEPTAGLAHLRVLFEADRLELPRKPVPQVAPALVVDAARRFKYRAEIKINDKGNSGLYFRTKPKPGFVDGYEAQIDSTHSDPIRTGSLYGMCHVYKKLVEPDAWFTYELEVRDDVWRGRPVTKIKITVNGDELYEYFDFDLTFKEGHFAFQQHDPGSKVSIRKIEVLELPAKK